MHTSSKTEKKKERTDNFVVQFTLVTDNIIAVDIFITY